MSQPPLSELCKSVPAYVFENYYHSTSDVKLTILASSMFPNDST